MMKKDIYTLRLCLATRLEYNACLFANERLVFGLGLHTPARCSMLIVVSFIAYVVSLWTYSNLRMLICSLCWLMSL